MNPTESLRERIARAIYYQEYDHISKACKDDLWADEAWMPRHQYLKAADAILALLPTHQPAEAGDESQDDFNQMSQLVMDAAEDCKIVRERDLLVRAANILLVARTALARAKPRPDVSGLVGEIDALVDASKGKKNSSDALAKIALARRVGQVWPSIRDALLGDGWRDDMENAPRDGRETLIIWRGKVFTAQWGRILGSKYGWICRQILTENQSSTLTFSDEDVSAWMPIPQLPAAKTGGE